MSRLLTFWIIGAALLTSGCATTPPESPWESLTTDTKQAVAALDCGLFPFPSELRDTNADGEVDTAVYDEVGINALEQYRICSVANESNVDEHAAQIMQLKVARKALVEAGKAQRNIADMRQEMLKDERIHNFWQNIGMWVLVMGAIAL